MKNVGKKQWMLKGLLLGMLLCLMLGVSAQAGWKTNNKGKRYYINKQEGYAVGWKKISNKWYYFDKNGYAQRGWLTIGSSRYYLCSRYYRFQGKWFTVGGNQYYAMPNGKLVKSKWVGDCYVKSNYRRAKGKGCIKGKYYYFDPQTGKKAVSTWKKIGGKYYYFQADGTMAVNTWVGKYQVGADGARTGKTHAKGLVTENGKIYFYDNNYNKIVGWKTINGNRYYFGKNGAAAIGMRVISGKQYYFTKDGVMVKNKTVTTDGLTRKYGADGSRTDFQRGKNIAKYAKKFIGGKYVYGGNDLNTGVDCSGFAQQVMKKFGIAIPRISYDQQAGKDGWGTYTKSVSVPVSTKSLKPGDLLFYGGSMAGHVAVYIGNGKIVHAKDWSYGIVMDNYNYNTPSSARRYW